MSPDRGHIDIKLTRTNTRAVPNIRFVFTLVPNSDMNSLFVFGRIVHPKTNTNSMTLTRPRCDERTAVGSRLVNG